MNYTFHVIFRPEPQGGYTALVPSLPGCISYGETFEEAQIMIQEAAELYLESVKNDENSFQDDSNILESRMQIAIPA